LQGTIDILTRHWPPTAVKDSFSSETTGHRIDREPLGIEAGHRVLDPRHWLHERGRPIGETPEPANDVSDPLSGPLSEIVTNATCRQLIGDGLVRCACIDARWHVR
jgi:hypothetical protein